MSASISLWQLSQYIMTIKIRYILLCNFVSIAFHGWQDILKRIDPPPLMGGSRKKFASVLECGRKYKSCGKKLNQYLKTLTGTTISARKLPAWKKWVCYFSKILNGFESRTDDPSIHSTK